MKSAAKTSWMDLLVAGTAAATSGAICNPMEVVKTRMQLQGELKSKGQYAVHYRNAFHALYTIASKDGILALWKGIVPFILYQFAANSTRLGLFQMANNKGLTKKPDGSVSTLRTLLYASASGVVGGVACSPFYLVKTHLQSKANEKSIAVGHQHGHEGTLHAIRSISRDHGFLGLWRGTSSMIPRIVVASATQITSFEVIHEYTKRQFPGSTWTPLFISSFATGFFITCGVAPLDVISCRFFNQGTDANGKGLYYRSVMDCAVQTWKKEGIAGFFKGWTACYFRLGPYTFLVMVIWDRLKYLQKIYIDNEPPTK